MDDIEELRQQWAELSDRLAAESAQWSAIDARLTQVRANIDAISAARRGSDPDAYATLTDRLAAEIEEFEQQTAELQRVGTNMRAIQRSMAETRQAMIAAVERATDMGNGEKSADEKAFWDPQDDEDATALTERIDALAARIEDNLDAGDEDEAAELAAELRDLLAGLTDDRRFRVQELIDRLGLEEKAVGAHSLYR